MRDLFITLGAVVATAFFLFGVFAAIALVIARVSENDNKIPLSEGCVESRDFQQRNTELCKMYFLSGERAK